MEPNIEMDTDNNLINNKQHIPETPKYGVLKNGKLPTYRSYFNKTQKNGSIFEKISIPDMNIRNKEITEKKNKKDKYGPIHK